MIVKGLITNVNTDAELLALTGYSRNDFVWHTGNNTLYVYEPNFATGDYVALDGGYWVKETIQALSLEEYKDVRYKEIDARTEEKILLGFSYQGKVFSMSANAQTNILALDNTRDDPALIYPITYNTLDDLDSYNVVDSTDLHNMYLTALATKKAWVDSGTLLKDSVRDAIDEQAVQAIIDNR
jgi:hypothetical protein